MAINLTAVSPLDEEQPFKPLSCDRQPTPMTGCQSGHLTVGTCHGWTAACALVLNFRGWTGYDQQRAHEVLRHLVSLAQTLVPDRNLPVSLRQTADNFRPTFVLAFGAQYRGKELRGFAIFSRGGGQEG